MAVRTILNDEIWDKFRSAMKVAGMRISASTKRIMEGIFWYLRTGSPWRDLPLEFGNWKTAYSRFNRWSKNGKLYKVFKELQDDPDFEWVSIDSTSIKVHQHASGGAEDTSSIGKSRGGRNIKVHASVDALGNVVDVFLGAGNRHDIVAAPKLIKGCSKADIILADKAYDSDAIRKLISLQHSEAVIPIKKTEKRKSILTSTSTACVIKLRTFSKD